MWLSDEGGKVDGSHELTNHELKYVIYSSNLPFFPDKCGYRIIRCRYQTHSIDTE